MTKFSGGHGDSALKAKKIDKQHAVRVFHKAVYCPGKKFSTLYTDNHLVISVHSSRRRAFNEPLYMQLTWNSLHELPYMVHMNLYCVRAK